MHGLNHKKINFSHTKNIQHGRNYGFTLVEMVVVLIVLSIMLTLSVRGLLAWQDWSDFQKENEYAQTLFTAAQNQLAEYSADGRLEDLKASLSGGKTDDKTGNRYEAVGLNLTDAITSMKDTDGNAYDLSALFPESDGKENPKLYQKEIVSLRAQTGEYEQYLDDPDALKASDPQAYWVFELLGSYVYDTSILNGSKSGGSGNGAAICVELAPDDGQVFAVLYSDKNDKLIYLGNAKDTLGSEESAGCADISDRETGYRRDRMVGYYGVDTLYTATQNAMIRPSISSVKLYNKETFYLTCRLSASDRSVLTSQLTYEMDLDASKNVNDKKMTISLDGTKLKNKENASVIDCAVSRYEEDGSKTELGQFPVLAWVEPDYTIHVMLDGADIQATTYLYEKELSDIRDPKKAAFTKFAKTYSFFRFGVEADNVYASVTATGEGFQNSKTVSNFGNLNLFQNQDAKHTCFAGETVTENGDKKAFTYTIRNARHLYNMRYIEDLSYEKEAGSVKAAEKIESVTFAVKEDIDFATFQKDGWLYSSYDSSGVLKLSSLDGKLTDAGQNEITHVTRYNCDFPSVTQIRARDVLDGNGKKITGIAVSEISNALYGIYTTDKAGAATLDTMRPAGFVNVNYGEIKDLQLDEITASGYDYVGGFCGINAGQVSDLTTLNTKENSLIAGRKHVGGIIGFQIPYAQTTSIEKLENHAEVEGVEAVGGILGMLRSNFALAEADFSELTGLSAQSRKLLENTDGLQITVADCKNYGVIAGVNTSELKEIYKADGSQNTTKAREENEEEPRYIGGIVGYCYNDKDDHNDPVRSIVVKDCLSAPEYKDTDFISILADESLLKEKLKGVYVGGIAGYNYYGQIEDCRTATQKGKEGCLFGYRYVGGIVGFNIGPASVVASTGDGNGENNNHVVAYQYAGGIIGCNANVRDTDSEDHDISAETAKDPEKLEGLLLPASERDLTVKIDHWINKAVVIATDSYAGGITGYNAGYIYACNSDVQYADAEKYFATLTSGDYAGGIAGYNNGVIGNTQRNVNADGSLGMAQTAGSTFATVCYVKGHNYVGGIVGYNDVDAVVEDYEIGSGYVLGDTGSCFVGGYAGLNASVDLLMNKTDGGREARFIRSNPSRAEGDYFVGGTIGGNLINTVDDTDLTVINGVFVTDNFLGTMKGKEFVGGFIGYNLLFSNQKTDAWIVGNADAYRGGVYILQKKLVDAFQNADASASDTQLALVEKKEILDQLSDKLDLTLGASGIQLTISGKEAESTKVSFGSITGDLYVGGVLGYNDANTKLLVQNVENATPVEAQKAVPYAEEQIEAVNKTTGKKTYRSTDYMGRDKTYTYSYTGGIIGKVNPDTTLDHCYNASTGTVSTTGVYTGGLCEINEGTVKNCEVSNFGSSSKDYVGGLCGLNKGLITGSSFVKKTVSGRNVVGGIAAENFGTIENTACENAKMIVEGRKVTGSLPEGVAGLYAAYNGEKGIVKLAGKIKAASLTSGGAYVGLVTGINAGSLVNLKAEDETDKQFTVAGQVRGYQTVGGLIGLNTDQDAAQEIAYYTNEASVVATNGNAGGIVGENASPNVIHDCINNAVVTASDAGNAGGITSVNNGVITKCTDYKAVRAPEGMCGGIVALNEKNGTIKNCRVEAGEGTQKLTFTSTKAVGAVAAQNAGKIETCELKNVEVTNETDVQKTSLGGIAGDNLKGGSILIGDTTKAADQIEDCRIIVKSNYSNAGGIAGTNAGTIAGAYSKATGVSAAVINCDISMDRATIASIGGVAGKNTGSISYLSVDAKIQGDLGSKTTGYGGIAGYSGYTGAAKVPQGEDYPAQITNCSFDGVINATGSSGAPVRVGGITGINGYGSLVESSYIGTRNAANGGSSDAETDKTYITAGDYKNKTAESYAKTDTRSYAYLGGITGDNYGKISACDNQKNATDEVHIIGFAGETAGIAAYNYPSGIVTGYEENGTAHYLTTGENWTIEQRCASNDRGPGGIIGISDSAQTMSYVINYAPVSSNYQANTYAAGLIGVLQQQKERVTEFYYCENRADIVSAGNAGGLIGLLKSNGSKMINCINYGKVRVNNNTNQDKYAGGMVALHQSFVAGFEFRGCQNHGEVSISRGYAGGFVGGENDCLGVSNNIFQYRESHLYDCVNTGIIRLDGVTKANNKAGSFYGYCATPTGTNNMDTFLELCRSYNTYTSSADGFVGSGKEVYMKNCFDDSNNTTNNATLTPFGGRFKNQANVYYLNESSQTQFSHQDYGVYFSLHQKNDAKPVFNDLEYSKNGNHMNSNDLRDNHYFFAEPTVSNQIRLNSANASLQISLDYSDDSQGIDSFVIYCWNGQNNKNNSPSGNYTCKATYLYADGSQKEVSGSARGYYNVQKEAAIVLKNEGAAKPVAIQLDFSGNTRLRGFAYIPMADTQTEAVCTYLTRKTGTAFSIDEITVNGSLRENFNQNRMPEGSYLAASYPNDALDIDFTGNGSYFGVGCNKNQNVNITFNIENDKDATGMQAFVFYPVTSDNNTAVTRKYTYSVTFTDIKGNTAETEPETITAYSAFSDEWEKARQEVKVPDTLDAKIESCVLHVKSADVNNVCWKGFTWIPVGKQEQKMASGAGRHIGSRGTVLDQNAFETHYSITKLMVDKSGSTPYVYLPYNYANGFYMSEAGNDPIGQTYYNDRSEYDTSVTDAKNSGSRIDTYLDLDPKLMQLSAEFSIAYHKLDAPRNLKNVKKESRLYYDWEKVRYAYAYEYYYEIIDRNDTVVETSDRTLIGNLERVVDVKIKDEWAADSYRIRFYVRAVNAYHIAYGDPASDNYDPRYEKYDSDWATVSEVVQQKALPKPEMHIEYVAGNRAVFVLDNYDEYVAEECTDSTIYIKYNGTDYTMDVSKGSYSEPITLNTPVNGSLASIMCYASPNSSISRYFIASENYTQSGEADGSNTLPNKDKYCDTGFRGFYGTQADSMEYRIVFTLKSRDSYLATDILAYDEAVGATVAYDTEITHAANSNSGSNTVELTSTLKNLPKEWFAENKVPKITVRAYLYRSQSEIVHYGHDVLTGITLDGSVEENREKLSEIVDSAYIPADSDERTENPVWDAGKNDLKPGYVLRKQQDGTYDLYYSAVVEMSVTNAAAEADREYKNYEVAYCIYSGMAEETNGVTKVNSADYQESYFTRGMTDKKTYNNTDTTSNDREKVQQIQSVPVVEAAVTSANAQGKKQYTFTWDKFYEDSACLNAAKTRYESDQDNQLTNAPAGLFATWDAYLEKQQHAGLSAVTNNNLRGLMNAYRSSYQSGQYRVDLVGTTQDGKEVILSTRTVTESQKLSDMTTYEAEDGTEKTLTTKGGASTTYHVWQYTCSFTDADGTWDTYPVLTARIMRLGSLSSVQAYNYNNGNAKTDPNGAAYILPRYAQSAISQKLPLSTISKPEVMLHRENGQFITDDLVYDVSWSAITDSNQKADLGGYLIRAVVKDAASDDTKAHYYYVLEGKPVEALDLDLESLMADGVVADVTEDYTQNDDTCMTKINLSDFNTADVVEISVQAIALRQSVVYGNGSEGVQTEVVIPDRLHVPDLTDLTKVWAIDPAAAMDAEPVAMDLYAGGIALSYAADAYPQDNDAQIMLAAALYEEKPEGAETDASVVTTAFDEGALKSLYTKENPLSLGKLSDHPAATVLNLTEFERYPGEFAGKWLKIALKAESATKIDSQWTDRDKADATTNYIWLKLPVIQLNAVDLTELGQTEEGDIVRYALDGSLSDTSTGDVREIAVATKSLRFTEDKNSNGYRISLNSGTVSGDSQNSNAVTIYLQRHLTDETDAETFDGTWDVYVRGSQAMQPAEGEQKPVCRQDAEAVWAGMLGAAFESDGAAVYDLLTLPAIGQAFELDTEPYFIPMQLRYQTGQENGQGSFTIVLPDVTMIGENPYDADAAGVFTEQLRVSQYVEDGRAYVAGADGSYSRQ